MKRKCWMFAIMLAVLPLGQACQQAERDEPPAPSASPRPAQRGADGPQLSQEPYLTLAEIDADPYTTLIPVPAGYALEKAGVWNFSEAYLLVGAVQGGTAEVYVFANENEYMTAGCDHKWVSNQNKAGETVAVTCESPGSNCTVTSNCLIKCVQA